MFEDQNLVFFLSEWLDVRQATEPHKSPHISPLKGFI